MQMVPNYFRRLDTNFMASLIRCRRLSWAEFNFYHVVATVYSAALCGYIVLRTSGLSVWSITQYLIRYGGEFIQTDRCAFFIHARA